MINNRSLLRDLIENHRQHWFYFQSIPLIPTLSVTINFFLNMIICILFPHGKQPFVIFSDFCIFYFDRTIYSYNVTVLELVFVILMFIKATYMYGS